MKKLLAASLLAGTMLLAVQAWFVQNTFSAIWENQCIKVLPLNFPAETEARSLPMKSVPHRTFIYSDVCVSRNVRLLWKL